MGNAFDLPDDHAIRVAHRKSIRHRDEIEISNACGCFHCRRIFPPDEITVWTDDGKTALCPYCGIDSVIGDQSGFDITAEFLADMERHWF